MDFTIDSYRAATAKSPGPIVAEAHALDSCHRQVLGVVSQGMIKPSSVSSGTYRFRRVDLIVEDFRVAQQKRAFYTLYSTATYIVLKTQVPQDDVRSVSDPNSTPS
jgi:hypothetical protein